MEENPLIENHIKDSTSLGDMFRRTVKAYGTKVALMIPGGKGEYSELTYNQMFEQVFLYARALDGLGLKRGDRISLMAESCSEWALTDWAAQTLGIITIPIYPTLPPDQAQYIAKDSQSRLAVTLDKRLSDKLSDLSEFPTYCLRPGPGEPSLLAQADKSKLSKEEWNRRIDAIALDDFATFIYTSGTTGNPKGAMLTHRNFVSLCVAILDTLPIDNRDTFLSFLPLSHVFERFAGHVLPVGVGATIGYAGSLASLASDMQKVRPTVMLCVPRFLESTRAKVIEGVEKMPPLRQKLFHWTLSQGAKRARGEFAPFAGILDKLVGAKIRDKMGGRINLLVSGGAALAPHVSEFYLAFRFNILQGYGLTETTAATCVNPPADNRPWTVGPAIRGVELEIAGDGEILIRGDSVMKGYYNLPEETAKAIDSEGWFHTGDIGEIENGYLKITDRKKDLLVLGNGKNVAPQPIENKLKESEYINEAVLLGDGQEYCSALIVPEFDRIKAFLKEQGINETDPEKMIAHDSVKALIKGEVDKANKTLADFERAKRHAMIPKPFTVDDGELTPSLKVRKKVVKEIYADIIKSMQREK